MKREQAEKEIRSIKRTCRGPFMFTKETQNNIHTAFHAIDCVGKREDFVHYLQMLRSELGLPKSANPVSQLDLLNFTLETMLVCRGCGYDFNETVIAGPWDGQEHQYVCPKCGLNDKYTAPLYIIDE